MADDGDVSLLVIVVDVNPIWWGQQILKESQFTLSKCMDAVMVMGNSHLAMSRKHRLAIIASHSQESRFLYPGKQWKMGNFAESGDIGSTESNCSGSKDGKYELLAIGNDIITEEIKDLMSKIGQELNSRILVIKAAEDSASQYMNFMNVIFAAQKQNILIDACVLDSESGLLQQASDITGGLYLKIPQMLSLSQYLLWVFLPDPEQRSQLVLPPPVHVDYRAACFCHRNLIEIGYVCSVCLSIFCNFSPICTTCETAFRIALPPVLKTKKKKPKLSTHNYLTS
ncbi:general transcription factor IIH subunit 3 isoform X4 [Chiloscyllium plagiosum]|uniref:general transcription factor IIH subunit 3 isoform X4 n=1 Tax=Chiloscyllium plagiosum TaxID=36176 RepID=UPI001CB845CA|nr:general transcription factor IIH subunit 3 isoform X4 [Chiloscyllium plagiosum]